MQMELEGGPIPVCRLGRDEASILLMNPAQKVAVTDDPRFAVVIDQKIGFVKRQGSADRIGPVTARLL